MCCLVIVIKVKLENGSIRIPREILRMLGLADGSEVIIAVSGDRIIIRPYRREALDIDSHIEWLRKNAPACFSEKETVVESKWVSIDWMRKKLGLKQ